MVAATTTLCQECTVQPSKYTCPACKARTCSLACTKAHKSEAASHPCSATGGSSSASSSSAATASTALGRSSTNSTATSSGTSNFVPLKDYSESHMMQDYLFLSSISRSAAENGRRIMAMNLMPLPSSSSAADASHKNSHHTHANNNNNMMRMTNQQRQREHLIKQLHYRKFRVMILPDGMARRKANQSAFNPKDKKFVLSVEIKLPCHSNAGKGKGIEEPNTSKDGEKQEERTSWLLHKQDPERQLSIVVLNELEKRSFANRKELGKLKDALPKSSVKGAPWIVSLATLAQVQLPVPESSKPVPGRNELVALDAFPKAAWALVVPAYSARLTNESTTRYLEWWVRKRKWEEANPEAAAKQKEDEAREGLSRRTTWGRTQEDDNEAKQTDGQDNGWPTRDGAKGVENESQPETQEKTSELPSEAAIGGGIVSSSLLSMLSQRLGRNQATLEPQPSASVPEPTPPSPPPAPPAAKKDESEKSILVHPTSPSTTTLAHLLRSLPDNYSVVEYPEVRVIPVTQLEELKRTGKETVVDLAPETAEAEAEEVATQDEQKDKATGRDESTVTVLTSGSLGGLLAGYDSDSDDADEPEPTQTEATVTIEEKKNQTDRTAPTEEAEGGGGSLAQLASMHGFFSSTGPSQS